MADRASAPYTAAEQTAFALCANGHRIYVEPSDERGKRLTREGGTFNPLAVLIWQSLLAERQWTHVIDVGANYGEMLVGVDLPQSARVIAMEPNPYVVPYLRRTLNEAGIKAELVAKAASARSGVAALTIDRDWSGTSSLLGVHPKSECHATETIEVPAITLAALIGERTDPRSARAVLKIDVEGHELAVLLGLGGLIGTFQEFAAMIEIVHLDAVDWRWLLSHFRIELLDEETKRLTQVHVETADELQRLLGDGKFYRQDAVLRRSQP